MSVQPTNTTTGSAAPINLSELRERKHLSKQTSLLGFTNVVTLSVEERDALVEAVEAAQAYVHWQDTRRIQPAYRRMTKALARFASADTPT